MGNTESLEEDPFQPGRTGPKRDPRLVWVLVEDERRTAADAETRRFTEVPPVVLGDGTPSAAAPQ